MDAMMIVKRIRREERRMERWARFERSARDGLAYSRSCARRAMKPASDGGALPEWKLRRIIP